MARLIALTPAEAGINVVVAHIDLEAAEAVSLEVREHGVQGNPFNVDVSERDEVEGARCYRLRRPLRRNRTRLRATNGT